MFPLLPVVNNQTSRNKYMVRLLSFCLPGSPRLSLK